MKISQKILKEKDFEPSQKSENRNQKTYEKQRETRRKNTIKKPNEKKNLEISQNRKIQIQKKYRDTEKRYSKKSPKIEKFIKVKLIQNSWRKKPSNITKTKQHSRGKKKYVSRKRPMAINSRNRSFPPFAAAASFRATANATENVNLCNRSFRPVAFAIAISYRRGTKKANCTRATRVPISRSKAEVDHYISIQLTTKCNWSRSIMNWHHCSHIGGQPSFFCSSSARDR